MKYLLFYIIFSIPLTILAQWTNPGDTIHIKEVLISRQILNSQIPGYKKHTIDSTVFSTYSHGSITDMLSENSPIFIKSYGMGGIATTSFRGTAANHTQITWNSINTNSPMVGQSDLSIIPTGLIDAVDIYFGGASMVLNSGGIGGAINIITRPVWVKETNFYAGSSIESFSNFSNLIKLKSGNLNFQSSTKIYIQSAKNDFPYLNTEISANPVSEIRKYSQTSKNAFVQELYFRRLKNIVSARFWYQNANRNLPGSMLTLQVYTGEKQYDESIRSMLSLDHSGNRLSYYITSALIYNRLNYYNQLVDIDSRNLSKTLTLKSGIVLPYKRSVLKIDLIEELSVVNSNNYDNVKSKNNASISAILESNELSRFRSTILIRQILFDNSLLSPDFSSAFQYKLLNDKNYYLKASVSKNSKIPSMNDLYWMPGGNTDLKKESAFMYELGFNMAQKINVSTYFNYDVTYFKNYIKDMIQWHPGDYSYWSADNIGNVHTDGLETSLSLSYSVNKIKSQIKAAYTFTNAIDYNANGPSRDKQLMYIPKYQANSSFMLTFKDIHFIWKANFLGKRFITVDNSKYLPQYMLNSIFAGYKLELNNCIMELDFNIDNIFSVNYQSIAYYPLPGRSYSLKLALQIVK